MINNFVFKRLSILLAVLISITCVAFMVGCGNTTETSDGDQNNGENTENNENNENNENGGDNVQDEGNGEIIAKPDCGHKLNKYGFCGTCQVDMSRVTVAFGKDITLEYHIAVHDPDLINGKKLQVVINDGDHVEVITDLAPEDNGYVFKYHGIAPHQMSHRVDAALVVVDDGELTVIDDILNYTVKQNVQELINAHEGETEIVQILSDILRYGAAAQVYQNYETDDLATDGIVGLAPERTELPDKSDMTLTEVEGAVDKTYFRGATVWFGSTTRLKITVVTDDISKVALKVNGVDVSGDQLVFDEAADVYYYYTDDIGMAHFGDVYTFVLYENGTEVETLTYSVNSYVFSKLESEDEKLADLVVALYRAGLSAAGWVATHNN